MTRKLKFGTTLGLVSPVLARAADLYSADAGSIPVTGSTNWKQSLHTEANSAETMRAGRYGQILFDRDHAEHFRL